MSVQPPRGRIAAPLTFNLLVLALFTTACSDVSEITQPQATGDAVIQTLDLDLPNAEDPTYLFAFNNSDGWIEEIGIPSGVATDVGYTGWKGASGLATSRATFVVGSTSYPPGTHVGMINNTKVIAVDTKTGNGTFLVDTNRNIGGRGIAFGPDGKTLYLIESSGVGAGKLSTIDLNTGAVVEVGSNLPHAASLEYDPDSQTFYALQGSQLHNISPSGTLLGSVPLTGPTAPTGTPCTLARWPDTGMWYTMDGGGLYELSLDGTASRVGNSGLGSRCGTAFAPKKAVNQPPVGVATDGPYTSLEGQGISMTGVGFDPQGEPVTFEWDFGDGTVLEVEGPPPIPGPFPGPPPPVAVTHAYGDNGTYTVTLTVKDPSGLGTVAYTEAVVGNVAPTIESLSPSGLEGGVGELLGMTLSFSDPGFDDTFTILVDWGDGFPAIPLDVANQDDVTLEHAYVTGGTFQGTVTVFDDDGGSDEVSFQADVNADITPPVITAVVDGTLGGDDWYVSDVDVSWTIVDEESDFEILEGCDDTTIDYDTDGVTLSCMASSEGGWAEASVTLKRDATAPAITVEGNAGAYDVADFIDISCSVFEEGSGIAAKECVEFFGPAYTFPLGTTSYTASATDVAGNSSSESGSFDVSVSFDGVCSLVEQFVSHKGVANSLCAKLRAAARARNDNARRGPLSAFINEVEAQSGKKIDPDDALILIALAESLM